MFSPAKMVRLDALVLKKNARAALAKLAGSGEAELLPAGSMPGTRVTAEDKSLERNKCAALTGRLAALRRALGVEPAAESDCHAEFDLAQACAALSYWESRAEAPLGRRKELSAQYSLFSAETEKLSPYSGLQAPSESGRKFSFLYCAAGAVPAENLAALRRNIPGGAVLALLGEKNGSGRLAALCGPGTAPALSAALKISGFRDEELPARPGFTLAALGEYCFAEERRVKAELEKTGLEIQALSEEASGPLAAVERAAAREAGLVEAEGGLGNTATVSLISAWVTADSAEDLAHALAEVPGGSCAAEIGPPTAGSDVPVLLRPPRLLRPFAMLVSAYGLPAYGEVEPTLFAAASFLFMFGMMFGDAGHGAVLCAVGLWLALRGRSEKMRDAGRIVFSCGLSAAFFGIIYGSFFGLEKFRKYALWRDPLSGDPLVLLKAALAAGVAVISLGLILNVINRLRAGDIPGAALGRFGFAGLVFYWAGISMAAGAAPRHVLPIMGLAVVCWVIKEPVSFLRRRGGVAGDAEEGFLAVAAEALVGAFEGALLYLANSVSFVRLAAYAMSHAALLAAAYALAEAADNIWGRGSLAGILAAVAGNAAAIGLEGLVAAVQALRLEYYEFFGKFLEGGGRPFRPFTLENKGG